MKKTLAIAVFCICFIWEVSAENSWGSNFFPVENDRQNSQQLVVLPFECTEGKNIEWNDKYQSALNGLGPDTKIRAFSREGSFVKGMLGSPTCFTGVCRTNYVALPVTTDDDINDVLLISRDAPFIVTTVAVIKNEECEEVPDDPKNPHGFDFTSLPTECHDITWGDSSPNRQGQTVSFGWRQENDWDVFHQFFRSVNNVSKTGTKYGALKEVTYSTSKQFPIFEFNLENKKPSLLWYQRSGLGPVAHFNLRESTFDEKGNLHWNSEYVAGGQPCD